MPKFANVTRILRLISGAGAVDNVTQVLAHRSATEARLVALEAHSVPALAGSVTVPDAA